jgi:hypothetical protein
MDLEALRYPVGKWNKPAEYQDILIKEWIEEIRKFPSDMSKLYGDLDESQLENRYRPGGWTLRQIAHHVVDSHMNAYIRHKLTLTETEPRITPYKESLWAELEDVRQVPVIHSLQILHDLHLRWTVFLDSIPKADLQRCFYHPEQDRLISLQESIGMYAWHCRHHYAHAGLAVAS